MVFCFPFSFIQGKQHCNINNMKTSIIINWFYQFPCNQNTIPINFRTRYLILANLSIKLMIQKQYFGKDKLIFKKCLRWSFLLQLQALAFQTLLRNQIFVTDGQIQKSSSKLHKISRKLYQSANFRVQPIVKTNLMFHAVRKF